MKLKDLLKEGGVSYEFSGDAYRQTKEYERENWQDYVDYEDLKHDFVHKGKKYITVNAAGDDYDVVITDRDSFEVYQFDEDGENPVEVKDTKGLYDDIAEELNDFWYDWSEKNRDDY